MRATAQALNARDAAMHKQHVVPWREDSGGLNGMYMCRIIRQARNQSTLLLSRPLLKYLSHTIAAFCLQITERAPALSTAPGAYSHRFVIFSLLLFSPQKKKNRKGGQGRPGVGEGILGCLTEGNSKEKKVSDFSLGSPAAGA